MNDNNDIVPYRPIENHYIQVDILFAKRYGLNEAILFDKLIRLLGRFEGTLDENGNKWVRMTLVEWMEELPFLESRTIRRVIANAEKIGLIFSRTFNGRCKWYRCNPIYIATTGQKGQLQVDKMDISSGQNGQLPISSPISNPISKDKPNGLPPGNSPNEKTPSTEQPKKELYNYFLEYTHIPPPQDKKETGFWYSQLAIILNLAQGDARAGKKLIKSAYDKLAEDDLTVSSPGSLVKTIRFQVSQGKQKIRIT